MFASKLTAEDSHLFVGFGNAVALSGDTAVVGSYAADARGEESGAVYAFVHEDGRWKQQARLAPTELRAFDHFGWAVAIEDDVLVASSHSYEHPHLRRGPERGLVHLYRLREGAWQVAGALSPEAPGEHESFGFSLALVDGMVVVGAPAFKDGSVTVFRESRAVWTREVRLAGSLRGRVDELVDEIIRSDSCSHRAEPSPAAMLVERDRGMEVGGHVQDRTSTQGTGMVGRGTEQCSADPGSPTIG